MAVADDKKRITITCSNEQVNKLDDFANKMGLNRGSLCTFLIAEGLLSLEKKYGMNK